MATPARPWEPELEDAASGVVSMDARPEDVPSSPETLDDLDDITEPQTTIASCLIVIERRRAILLCAAWAVAGAAFGAILGWWTQ